LTIKIFWRSLKVIILTIRQNGTSFFNQNIYHNLSVYFMFYSVNRNFKIVWKDLISSTTHCKLETMTDYDKLRRKVIWKIICFRMDRHSYINDILLNFKIKRRKLRQHASITYFSFLWDYYFILILWDLINASILELVHFFTYIYNYIFILWHIVIHVNIYGVS